MASRYSGPRTDCSLAGLGSSPTCGTGEGSAWPQRASVAATRVTGYPGTEGSGGSGNKPGPVSWHQAVLAMLDSRMRRQAPLALRNFIAFSLRTSIHRDHDTPSVARAEDGWFAGYAAPRW